MEQQANIMVSLFNLERINIGTLELLPVKYLGVTGDERKMKIGE